MKVNHSFLNCIIPIHLSKSPMLQLARDTGVLMDNKSIFKDIGKWKSNLCQGSPPDPHFYPYTRLAGGVIGFV